MKKTRIVGVLTAVSLLMSASFFGCSNSTGGSDSEPESSGTTGTGTEGTGTGSQSGQDNGGEAGGGEETGDGEETGGGEETPVTLTQNATLQALINNATENATVTLTAGTACAGTYISVTKALTIDGNNLEGLTVIVSSAISNNVTLKNLKKANFKVAAPASLANSNIRGFRGESGEATVAPAEDAAEGFKKIGEEALPLFIEGCTVEKFEAGDDVIIHLENGEKKSEFEEVYLKEGIKEFSFVEFDKADKPETTDDEATPTTSKSKVGKLSIESDEIERINLIGGVFDDVNIADDFSGDPIKFKYDKELGDQFGDDFDKSTFFGNGGSGDKIVEKDIGVIEKTETTGNVYSFTMSKDNFVAMNGFLSIAFMTDAQKQWMDAHNGQVTDQGPLSSETTVDVISCATVETPIYLMMPAGLFTVENPENATGLKTIYGSEFAYADYAHAIARGVIGYVEEEDIVVLDKYRNYNKEAVIVNFEGNNVTIYVNTAAVRKEDVILGNGEYTYPNFEAVTEIGTKVSDINLDGYKPYLIVDYGNTWENLPNGSTNHDGVFKRLDMENDWQAREEFKSGLAEEFCTIQNMAAIYGQTLKMSREMDSVLYYMVPADSYPTVSGVEYSSVSTPNNKSNPFFPGN